MLEEEDEEQLIKADILREDFKKVSSLVKIRQTVKMATDLSFELLGGF